MGKLSNLKIQHISFSSSGGAGNVASALAQAQEALGHDLHLSIKTRSNLRENPLRHPSLTLLAGLDEHFVKKRTFGSPISLYRSKISEPTIDPEADVVHLHWIEGFISLKEVITALDRGQKIFWTLHDMRPFSGTCHFALGCDGFKKSCGSCPAIHSNFQKTLDFQLRERALLIDSLYKRVHFIAPSEWLLDIARSSRLLKNSTITVIKNPVSRDFFTKVKSDVPRMSESDKSKIYKYGVIAADLGDPRKGVSQLVNEFRKFKNGKRALVLVGKNGEQFSELESNIHAVGALSGPDLVRQIDELDFLILPSKEDNSPLAVIEAASRGKPAIALDSGGVKELFTDVNSKFALHELSNLNTVMNALEGLPPKELEFLSHTLAKEALDEHSPENVAKKYLSLYRLSMESSP